MISLLTVAYLILCAAAAGRGVFVLYRMTPRTPHMRRLAFLMMVFGGMLGWIEVIENRAPALSMTCLAFGVVVLFFAGIRRPARSRRTDWMGRPWT